MTFHRDSEHCFKPRQLWHMKKGSRVRQLIQVVFGGIGLIASMNLLGACSNGADVSTEKVKAEFAAARECVEGGSSLGAPVAGGSSTLVIVGHAYGVSGESETNVGLDERLLNVLQKWGGSKEGIALTGDISRSGTEESFLKIKDELSEWQNVVIAPGNHDVGTPLQRDSFERIFGPQYGSERLGNSVVLWLDTVQSDWRIEGNQLDWLEQELASLPESGAKSLIVLTHHVIWSESDGTEIPFNGGPMNPSEHDPDQLPRLLADVTIPTVVVSGDAGAIPGKSPLGCKRVGSVAYVSSGIGAREVDAFLEVSLDERLSMRICTFDTELEDACRESQG